MWLQCRPIVPTVDSCISITVLSHLILFYIIQQHGQYIVWELRRICIAQKISRHRRLLWRASRARQSNLHRRDWSITPRLSTNELFPLSRRHIPSDCFHCMAVALGNASRHAVNATITQQCNCRRRAVGRIANIEWTCLDIHRAYFHSVFLSFVSL